MTSDNREATNRAESVEEREAAQEATRERKRLEKKIERADNGLAAAFGLAAGVAVPVGAYLLFSSFVGGSLAVTAMGMYALPIIGATLIAGVVTGGVAKKVLRFRRAEQINRTRER